MLADVSVPPYTRLERGGRQRRLRESVLEAFVRALLDEAERADPFDLARAALPTVAPRRRRRTKPHIQPSGPHILDGITGAAPFVRSGPAGLLAANPLGHALYSEMFVDAVG